LPAFSLDLGEFELFITRIIGLYNEPASVHIIITVELPSESLQFSTMEEMRQYRDLPERITLFSVYVSAMDEVVAVYSGRVHTYPVRPYVIATSGSEAWCAGAVETVYQFIQNHKLWYHWFVSAPMGWIVWFLFCIPSLAIWFAPTSFQLVLAVILGWYGMCLTLFLLYINREKLLPASTLHIAERQGFIRAHIAELSLAVAVLSAILMIVGWFVDG
jgi:hypothetical protein